MDQIITERLVLRELRKTDVLDFFIFAKNENVGPMAGWEPHKNINETKLMIDVLIKENEMWAITIKDQLIGTINVSFIDDLKYYELGFSLNEDYWNKGIISEAIAGVLNYCFNKTNINMLVSRHYSFNLRSESVLKKFGFILKKLEIDIDVENNEQVVYYYELHKKNYLKDVLK